MLVVHGMWLPGRGLAVWAEDSTLPPAAPRSPLDSPELVRTTELAPVRGPVTLAGWRVPVLAYAPDAALSLLRTVEKLAAAPGASLRHLAELATPGWVR